MGVLTDSEIEKRKPVWTALSELWLDTGLTLTDFHHIARVAAASGYTPRQLRDIYLYEVAPVVFLNLYSVAGVWEGFHETWLHTDARKRAEHRSLWLRFWVSIGIGRWLMTPVGGSDWRRILSLMDFYRSHPELVTP